MAPLRCVAAAACLRASAADMSEFWHWKCRHYVARGWLVAAASPALLTACLDQCLFAGVRPVQRGGAADQGIAPSHGALHASASPCWQAHPAAAGCAAVCLTMLCCAAASRCASLRLLVQAVALDPRYAARKTREVVYGTAQGTLILSSKASGAPHKCMSVHFPCFRLACLVQPLTPPVQPRTVGICRAVSCHVVLPQGWLGAKETILYGGKGPVHCARMSGTLLAWATSTGIRCAALAGAASCVSCAPAVLARLPACFTE